MFKKKNQKTLYAEQKEREALEVADIYHKGVITMRDLVAPASLEFNSSYFRLGTRFCRTIYVYGYPRVLYTGWLSGIVNLDEVIDISMFIYPVDSQVVMNNLRRKVTQLEAALEVNAEHGKVRDPALESAYQDAEELRLSLIHI